MNSKFHLGRKLVLEERVNTPDGAGGQVVSWVALGSHWADVTARMGREVLVGGREIPIAVHRIVVRGAPFGAPSRPRPDQRFREGARVYNILTVDEADPAGHFLICSADEGKAS